MAPTPLQGIRVIDCTHVLAGPYSAYQLGLMGADVIRVERVTAGEWAETGERIRVPGLGVRFDGETPPVTRPPARQGQHTDEVLTRNRDWRRGACRAT
ncbi:MAG: hypothetical protein HOI95_04950 [Chromatiales bacterium]|jgi:crotonobetainyl-CoA:carnitine CoA-transferase CaiB-like acyl-CoA transferase|nr:hypothetical protein [Chromatiales bacterium]